METKNALSSWTIQGLLVALTGVLLPFFSWGGLETGAKTAAVVAAVGWVWAFIGRLRQGDLHVLEPRLVPAILPFALVLGVAGCGTLPLGSGASPATGGSPASAGQLAQTVAGQQGQAPSTANGGTATANTWNMASQMPADFLTGILKLAGEQKWTAEQVTSALKAANGAPAQVTVTTGAISAAGGNASSIPAGTGGTVGTTGASSPVVPK